MVRERASRLLTTWITKDRFVDPFPIAGEEWITFNEFRGVKLSCPYQVSNKGRVRRKGGVILQGSVTFDGYHEIQLSRADSANGWNVRVHVIVLRLFVGDPPSDMKDPTVQHINHDKLDNRVENLCWMSSYRNNQEGHGRRTRIVDESGEHIFNSQKLASKYIGRYDDYIAECINHGYKIASSNGQEVEVYTEINKEWIKYVRSVPTNRNRCKLVRDDQIVEFDSFWACDSYLGQPKGYVSNAVLNSWPVLPNEAYEFYTFNHDTQEYEQYVATKRKSKNFATKCQITDSAGHTEIFPSITAAAKYIGRDSEYLRVAIKENRTIKDSNNQVVIAVLLS